MSALRDAFERAKVTVNGKTNGNGEERVVVDGGNSMMATSCPCHNCAVLEARLAESEHKRIEAERERDVYHTAWRQIKQWRKGLGIIASEKDLSQSPT